MIAESKILERAEMMLRMLSNGVNPLTEEALAENDTCRQERISKCLLYVADYLQKKVCPKPAVEKKQKAAPPRREREMPSNELVLTDEILSKFEISEEPQSLSSIVRKINALIPREKAMIPLVYADIAEVLTQEGILQKQEGAHGKESNLPTPRGEELGFARTEADIRGHFSVFTKCNSTAQRFVLDNIQKVVEQANARLARMRARKEADMLEMPVPTPGKEKFHLTAEQVAAYQFEESPIPVSEIARRLNSLLPAGGNVEQLYFKKIRDWFVARGQLEEHRSVTGKISFTPTEAGFAAGIVVDKRIGKNGEEYEAVLYSVQAQKLVLEHVNELA